MSLVAHHHARLLAAAGHDYTTPYLARMAARGFTAPRELETAIRRFEALYKAAGILAYTGPADCLDLAIYPLLGGTAATHALNFLSSRYELSFQNAPPHTGNGIEWTGQQYARTGILLSELAAQDVSLSVYTRQARGSGDTIDAGAIEADGKGLFLSSYSAFNAYAYGRGGYGEIPGSEVRPPGLFQLQTYYLVHKGENISPLGSVDSGASVFGPQELFLGGLNYNGVFYGGTPRGASYYQVGRAYSLDQSRVADQAVQELQIFLNRAV